MTTLQKIELVCPVCELAFQSMTVVSTSPAPGKHSDFREHAPRGDALPYLVHVCGRCGYAGGAADFAAGTDVPLTVRALIWSELAPRMPGSARLGPAAFAIAGSDKYDAAARIAEWKLADARIVAELYLRAAWCCVDENDVEAERYYRRKAAWWFELALESYDGVTFQERAPVTYLVGELWRRIGDVRLASTWFERVSSEIVDAESQRAILNAAHQQAHEPGEWLS